jgi:hypothetical protein
MDQRFRMITTAFQDIGDIKNAHPPSEATPYHSRYQCTNPSSSRHYAMETESTAD